ncbi:amino acid ABC transporter permease [Paenibacillus macquariensis]|uniref:Amino acid ABC transporter membrane protein, PAAT family n=1 Tax=Paenibacillus macquariensis TaxID=948756 RepID=A0ABY1JNE8_9BACL|nr:amino acid ABC transporter permease [Paenibacillus macquariensis]MEC0092179.1 amino acid ABC transporter permease [Paenibacillus macquariensis]OAB37270.1 cysteine ABC transporter permease [Paenibacillus macquariensis subsp. macquariensis]SIQ49597.1 amino acid ABC transporter membrane protein, PAAT family [Paenibacillus macquariensis]
MDERKIQIVLDSLLPLLKAGVAFTIPLTLISFAIGLFLAVLTAIVRISSWRIPKLIFRFYVWVIRGTPLLVQLFIIFYGLPAIGITLEPLTAAIIGFSLSVGAYSSEIVRAAIVSIPKGQWEAASSIGMTRSQALRRIILPQATRVSVPPLANSFIGLVKDTSLAASITYMEMFRTSQQIVATTYEPLLLYCEVGVIYLLFCSILSTLQNYLERRLARYSAS